MEQERENKIIVTNQNTGSINCVTKVISSTENCIQILINNKKTLIEGENLHITKLDIESGIVNFEGKINTLKLSKAENGKNFLKRIFK